jgi:hypothetical protein
MEVVRAIQFSHKRVGSTFLQNAINSHPNIMGIDEVFVNMAKKPGMKKSGFTPYLRSDANTPKNYIENIIYKKYPDKHTIFKLMYNQIEYHGGLMQYIIKNNIPMIHLMRKNLVKQILSGLNAATTKHDPIVVRPVRLLELVMDAHKFNILWKDRLANQIKLTLFYEDIIGETVGDKTYMAPNANIAVCDFFGIPQVQLHSPTKKKNKEDIRVYLPNYDEIKKVFKGSKFEWMIQ